MRRPRLTYANVVATLALFLVLGGGAYAAATLPRNSVGTRQLKRGAVTSRKLRTGAVSSRVVRNHTLRARDVAAGQLHAGPRGPAGPRGATGATGATGRTGTTGPAAPPAASVLLGDSTSPLTGGAVLAPSGPSAPGSQTFDNNQVSPSMIVARDLAVSVDTPPGPSGSRTFVLLAGAASTGVGCTIAGSDTECTSGAATGTIFGGSDLALLADVSGTPAPTNVEFGWRATTP